MNGNLYVVELDNGKAYLGCIEVLGPDRLVIKTGLRGKPPLVDPDEVERIVPADRHPDVVVV